MCLADTALDIAHAAMNQTNHVPSGSQQGQAD